jgi:hypothetical protein
LASGFHHLLLLENVISFLYRESGFIANPEMESFLCDRRGVFHSVKVQAPTVLDAACRASAIFKH